ncbi:AAA family ATPase [Nocardia asteroides]|uniref:AAA family ATPase n=1 Tax=Nocardia asteroides TaxID=1824 RepID=UPI0033F0BC9F
MQIRVLSRAATEPPGKRNTLFLRESDWNDWWKFATLYGVTFADQDGRRHRLGNIKVGQRGMRPPLDDHPAVRPRLPAKLQEFDEDTFSLGQDTDYYENVEKLGSSTREAIHRALRDLAYDLELFRSVNEEDVLWESLLRDVPAELVRGQFARLAHGDIRLTPFDFSFVHRSDYGSELTLAFEVRPDSFPPTNIHAIIGRNGVGKSTLLNAMEHSLINAGAPVAGRFIGSNKKLFTEFVNLVSVSFSMFDEFPRIEENHDRREFDHSYIGLESQDVDEETGEAGSQLDFQLDKLISAIDTCLVVEGKRSRFRSALEILEGDPIFAQLGLVELLENSPRNEFVEYVDATFSRLSSGHKIVLISITRLVATVEEKTLILIDEPESHLHPPLLSAYIRALSGLLSDRNGVAIIATHSPVVLQEIPATCVWKLSRTGKVNAAARPDIETFGENVGILTDEVFGLEVSATGFHKMIMDVAADSSTYRGALARFNGQLGMEGRAILRGQILNRAEGNT